MTEVTNLISSLYSTEVLEHTRQCIKCGIVRPLAHFALTRGNKKDTDDSWGKKGYRTECKFCTNDKNKLRKDLAKQYPCPTDPNYCCPICNRTEAELKSHSRWPDRKPWCVDHNHITGEFRGWICNSCNNAIGRFDDNPQIALQAYHYLLGAETAQPRTNINTFSDNLTFTSASGGSAFPEVSEKPLNHSDTT